jgi:hypothetical protein
MTAKAEATSLRMEEDCQAMMVEVELERPESAVMMAAVRRSTDERKKQKGLDKIRDVQIERSIAGLSIRKG